MKPPQFGKSTTITETVPAWWLGKHPDKKWIIASYSTDFASSFGRKNKEKCQEYNPKIFPGFRLADNPCNNTEFETTSHGGVYSAGLLAGITGHHADVVIIDDPIKTQEEADSDTHKSKIWNEYMSSVRSRLGDQDSTASHGIAKGKVIVIQTRWVEDDLIGRLIDKEAHVTYINIPCECDDPVNDPLGRQLGEGLCPEIGKGTAWLKDFKQFYISNDGSRAWNALYQGRPTAQGGNLIKSDWWQYYTTTPVDKFPYTIISVDATFKDGDNNDYVAIQKWGKYNRKYYLLRRIKKHLDFVNTLTAIRQLKKEDPTIDFILIEDKANGSALINVLRSEFEGVIPVKPLGGKVSRCNAVAPAIERGDVYLPQLDNSIDDYVREFSQFPNGPHDDEVDATTQALNRMLFVDADVGETPKNIKYTKYTSDMLEDFMNADDNLRTELIALWGYPANEDEND